MNANNNDPCDVAIIGGGPSGLSCAIRLRSLGVNRVVVIEREKTLGGIPRHCFHTGFGLRDQYRCLSGPVYAERLARRVVRSNVQVWLQTTALSWRDHEIKTTSPHGLRHLRARAIVLATGCRERPRAGWAVSGTRPSGIFTTGSLQQSVFLHHHQVGKRAVIVGAEHVSFSAVHTLAKAGITPVAMITEHPRHQTLWIFRLLTATRHRVPIFTHSRVVEIGGNQNIEWVKVENIETGGVRVLSCDVVIFTGNWIADNELSRRQEILHDPQTKGPKVDNGFRTSERGVFAVGNVAHGAEAADFVACEGKRCAKAVFDFLKNETWPASRTEIQFKGPFRWVFPNHLSSVDAPASRVRFQVSREVQHAHLEIQFGAQTVTQKRWKRLVPNRSYSVKLPSRVDPQDVYMQLGGFDGAHER